MPSLLQRAVTELGINVPVYRADLDEDRRCVVLYLVGHTQPKTWTPPEWVTDTPDPIADPVTTPDANPLPVEITPPARAVEPGSKDDVFPQAVESTAADFTVIPGVGKKTCQALHEAGYKSFQRLLNTNDHALLEIVNSYTLAKIKDYLYVHYL